MAHPKYLPPAPRSGQSVCIILALSFLAMSPGSGTTAHRRGGPISASALARLVEARRVVEEVYWRHRIWPADNPHPKPSLESVLPTSVIRARVINDLKKSAALRAILGRSLTVGEIQAELDRMSQETRRPEVLRELYASLHDDPEMIAAVLVRPRLADKLLRAAYVRDNRVHGSRRAEIEERVERRCSHRDVGCLGGMLTEVTFWRDPAPPRTDPPELSQGIPLAAARWDKWMKMPRGILQEEDSFFYLSEIVEQRSDSFRVATVSWPKQSFESWWSQTKAGVVPLIEAADSTLTLIPQPGRGCTFDAWDATDSTGAPPARYFHSAVWTGSEMIVWGGLSHFALGSGAAYDPATDSWRALDASGSPVPRYAHSVVWTGREMLVWGGQDGSGVTDTGGRYDPALDDWSPMSRSGSPAPRGYHTAVWTGKEMIVWGGSGNSGILLNSGGRYRPDTDSWASTDPNKTITPRTHHSAVWTGKEMIVWGGFHILLFPRYTRTGGIYDPVSDRWSEITNEDAPAPRGFHSAVWTGREMIVWGGIDGDQRLATGGRYDPRSGQWRPTSTSSAPAARWLHQAVWSGEEMIVWGGGTVEEIEPSNSGGRYRPSSDFWSPTATAGAPHGLAYHSAVWTGTQMIVWSGEDSSDLTREGGRYCACPFPGVFYADMDGDEFGNDSDTRITCDGSQPEGYVTRGGDCDDSVPGVNPGLSEVCNGVDDNCSGTIDEGGEALCGSGDDTCSLPACGGAEGCISIPAQDGALCSDGNPCTRGDTCLQGTCSPGAAGTDGTILPRISISLAPELLFPPNHTLTTIQASVLGADACGGPVRVELGSVTSNEPDDAVGDSDGHTLHDIQGIEPGTPDFEFKLRAERDEQGAGRIYLVVYAVIDDAGSRAEGQFRIRVPLTRTPVKDGGGGTGSVR